MKYKLLFLFFLVTDCTTLQIKKPDYTEKKINLSEKEKNLNIQSSFLKTPDPFENKQQEKKFNKDTQNKILPCNESGVKVFSEEKVLIGLKSQKLSKRALKILEREEKRNPKYCPENCRQKNIYKAFIQIGPISHIPHSCPFPESKEIYAFKKTFSLLKDTKETENQNNRKNREKLESQMGDWILRTFVYPYTPGAKFTPTKELLAHKIGDACPKCSFYFDYSYFFESDNQLNLDIEVRCGNRKKGLGFTRAAKLQIKNHWQCLDVTENNQ